MRTTGRYAGSDPNDISIKHLVHLEDISDLPFLALIDTGATGSFIDQALITPEVRRKVPIFVLDPPITLFLLDGSAATEPLTEYLYLVFRVQPTGQIIHFRVFVAPLGPEIPMIIGMNFLHLVRPPFNWPNQCLRIKTTFERWRDAEDPDIVPYGYRADHPPRQPQAMRIAKTADSPTDGSALIGSTSRSSAFDASPKQNDPAFFFDPDEDPDDVADILRVVPPVFHDYVDVFSKARAEKLPPHRSYDHSIDLINPDDLPAVGPIYSTSASEAQVLQSEIKGLLAKGFIRPSSAPLGAPVLFVKKKDNTMRMCIDYRQLNLRTKKNKYPLPPINFLLEQLSGAKVFSKIDLRGAYHLLRIAEKDEWKTTFRCRYGSFEFLVMPFGLTNAPSAFQHLINDVLREHLDHFVIAYLDDILVYSANPAEHESHVRIVLECLRSHNLYAKATKCAFNLEEVDFLGYIVGKNGLGMDPAKVETILKWPIPASVKAVQSFLGFANFYRRFVRDYSRLVSPMTALTKKNLPFQWTPACQHAFEELQHRFTSAPILAHFDPDGPTYLETDASDYAIGTILSQEGPDKLLHPVAYDSRKFQPAELNYEIHDKELLAIVWAFKRWRSMLLSAKHSVNVLTDHQALTYFMTNKQLNRRQVRWAEVLADYDFVITYRPGKQSEKPDALSRRDDVYPSGGDASYANNNPHNFTTLLKPSNVAGFEGRTFAFAGSTSADDPPTDSFVSALVVAQQCDPALQAILESEDEKLQPTTRSDKVLLLTNRIAVPNDDAVKLRILRQKHDHPTAGHPGRTKTLQLIARDYYWPNAKEDVADYISTCMTCLRNKTPRQKPVGPLQPLPIPERPWSSISMDFIEQLPNSGGFDSILVVVCRFTKMAVFVPTTVTATSQDLANLFLQHIWSKHGTPDDIVSDRGSKFVSKFWKALCRRLAIDRKVSTAYHPETDGQTERVNQVLEQYVRIYCAYQQNDWHEWLPMAEFAYNNSDHTSTRESPFKANYGFNPTIAIERGASAREPGDHYAYNLSDLHDRIRKTLVNAQEAQKRFADRKRAETPDFNIGDKVMLSTKNLQLARPTRKFSERYIGPYKISDKVSNVAFKLALPSDLSRIHPVFHVSLLRTVPDSKLDGRVMQPPGPVDLEDPEVFEVSEVVDSRIRGRPPKLEYKVRWTGYENTSQEYSWEPGENVMGSQDTIDEFHSRNPHKPKLSDIPRRLSAHVRMAVSLTDPAPTCHRTPPPLTQGHYSDSDLAPTTVRRSRRQSL